MHVVTPQEKGTRPRGTRGRILGCFSCRCGSHRKQRWVQSTPRGCILSCIHHCLTFSFSPQGSILDTWRSVIDTPAQMYSCFRHDYPQHFLVHPNSATNTLQWLHMLHWHTHPKRAWLAATMAESNYDSLNAPRNSRDHFLVSTKIEKLCSTLLGNWPFLLTNSIFHICLPSESQDSQHVLTFLLESWIIRNWPSVCICDIWIQ